MMSRGPRPGEVKSALRPQPVHARCEPELRWEEMPGDTSAIRCGPVAGPRGTCRMPLPRRHRDRPIGACSGAPRRRISSPPGHATALLAIGSCARGQGDQTARCRCLSPRGNSRPPGPRTSRARSRCRFTPKAIQPLILLRGTTPSSASFPARTTSVTSTRGWCGRSRFCRPELPLRPAKSWPMRE